MGIFSSKRFRKQRSIPEGRLPEKPLASSTPAIVSSTSDTTLSTGVLISRDGTLSSELVNTWEAVVSSNPKLSLSRSILPNNDICKTLQSWTARNAALYVFNNVLKHNVGPITDQGSSGRCWLFAATNVLRYKLMKSHDLKTFQLSQVWYLPFFPSDCCADVLGSSRILLSGTSSTRLTLFSSYLSNLPMCHWKIDMSLFCSPGLQMMVENGTWRSTSLK